MKSDSQHIKKKRSKRILGSVLASGTADIVMKVFLGSFIPPSEAMQRSGKKYLIINGDDLCMNDQTDEAILNAWQNGVLTSTSAFVNFPGSVERLKKIHLEHPDLPIGLHLNLTNGKPVSDSTEVKELTGGNGQFYDIDGIMQNLHRIPVEAVKKELHAQVSMFLSSGFMPDHLDYHFHLVALYTPFFEIVREIALQYNIPLRNPVPFSIYKLIRLNAEGGGSRTGIRKLIRFGITHPFRSIPLIRKVGPVALTEQKRLMQNAGVVSPEWLIDSFYNNARPETFVSILEQIPAGISEMACHPGRENELAVLTSPFVKQAIEELNIKLITYNDIEEVLRQRTILI